MGSKEEKAASLGQPHQEIRLEGKGERHGRVNLKEAFLQLVQMSTQVLTGRSQERV